MKGIKYVIQKELHRVFSDKKLMFSLFVLPAILMAGVMYLTATMAMKKEDDIKEHVPTVYVQNEPTGFTDFVKQCQTNANIVTVADSMKIDEIKDDIIDGKAELLYIFDDQFVEKVANYKKNSEVPMVQEFYNPSEDYSKEAQATFTAVLDQMRQSILQKRFGDDNALIAFDVKSEVILNETKATGQMLGEFIPYFVSILIFAGAMGLVVDAIAGEKERGTLASMLLTPVKRSHIALGKIISLIILSGLSATIYIVIMIVAFPLMFRDSGLSGLSIKISGVQGVELVALLLCMVFLYIGMISFASILAKDTKSASTYVAPMYLLVMVIGLASMFTGNDNPESYLYAIPLYGNSIAIQNIMINNISVTDYLINLGSTVIVAALLVAGLTKAFNSEKVMFNA